MSVQFGKCSMCDKPAVGAINTNANLREYVEAVWEPRCDEHNPYWNSQNFGNVKVLREALAEIAKGAHSGFELQQIAIRALADYKRD